jgi:hypothetical protein
LLTNETSRQWVSDLPTIIKAYNEFVKESKNATVSEEQIDEKLETTKTIECEGASCKLLDVGPRVRVILYRPIATDGEKKCMESLEQGTTNGIKHQELLQK